MHQDETAVQSFWDSLKGTMATLHVRRQQARAAEQAAKIRANQESEFKRHQAWLERAKYISEPQGRLVTLQQQDVQLRDEFTRLADRLARDAQEVAGIVGAKAARTHLDKTDKLLDKAGEERIELLVADKKTKISPRMTELRKIQKENHIEQELAEAELRRRSNNR
jgi:hypothetical protein